MARDRVRLIIGLIKDENLQSNWNKIGNLNLHCNLDCKFAWIEVIISTLMIEYLNIEQWLLVEQWLIVEQWLL